MRRQLPAHGSRQVVSGGNSCLTREVRWRATFLREDLERQATAAGPRGGQQPGTRGSREPPCVCRAIPHLPAQLNAQRQTRRSRCRPRSTCLQQSHGARTLPLGLTGPGHSRSIPRPPALQRHYVAVTPWGGGYGRRQDLLILLPASPCLPAASLNLYSDELPMEASSDPR